MVKIKAMNITTKEAITNSLAFVLNVVNASSNVLHVEGSEWFPNGIFAVPPSGFGFRK
jgi:hypothetical protein